jgi:hypothetical protein
MGLQFRRDTSANWSSVNPTLLSGEPAYEINTQIMRVGDGVTPYNNLPQFGGFPNAVIGGRLSLVQAAPISDPWNSVPANVSSATIFYVPCVSDKIALWSGISWQPYTFNNTTRLELAGLTANKVFDIFAYQVNGTVTLAAVQWASNINRAVGLVLLNGVLVRSGQAAMRYIGTIRTTGTIGTTCDNVSRRFVYNHYNQVTRPMSASYGVTHTYASSTWRIWNDNPADLQYIQLVQGFRHPIRVDFTAYMRYGAAQPRLMPGIPYKTTLAVPAAAGDTTITVVYADDNIYANCTSAAAAGLAAPNVPVVTNVNGNALTLSQAVISPMAAGTVVSLEPVQHLIPAASNYIAPTPLAGLSYMTNHVGGLMAGLSASGGFNAISPCQSGVSSDTAYGNFTLTAATVM